MWSTALVNQQTTDHLCQQTSQRKTEKKSASSLLWNNWQHFTQSGVMSWQLRGSKWYHALVSSLFSLLISINFSSPVSATHHYECVWLIGSLTHDDLSCSPDMIQWHVNAKVCLLALVDLWLNFWGLLNFWVCALKVHNHIKKRQNRGLTSVMTEYIRSVSTYKSLNLIYFCFAAWTVVSFLVESRTEETRPLQREVIT